MKNIEFRCLNCGNRIEKDLLPGKHTILGTLPIVNKEASCCSQPEYEDMKGFYRTRMEKSFKNLVPGLRA